MTILAKTYFCQSGFKPFFPLSGKNLPTLLTFYLYYICTGSNQNKSNIVYYWKQTSCSVVVNRQARGYLNN